MLRPPRHRPLHRQPRGFPGATGEAPRAHGPRAHRTARLRPEGQGGGPGPARDHPRPRPRAPGPRRLHPRQLLRERPIPRRAANPLRRPGRLRAPGRAGGQPRRLPFFARRAQAVQSPRGRVLSGLLTAGCSGPVAPWQGARRVPERALRRRRCAPQGLLRRPKRQGPIAPRAPGARQNDQIRRVLGSDRREIRRDGRPGGRGRRGALAEGLGQASGRCRGSPGERPCRAGPGRRSGSPRRPGQAPGEPLPPGGRGGASAPRRRASGGRTRHPPGWRGQAQPGQGQPGRHRPSTGRRHETRRGRPPGRHRPRRPHSRPAPRPQSHKGGHRRAEQATRGTPREARPSRRPRHPRGGGRGAGRRRRTSPAKPSPCG